MKYFLTQLSPKSRKAENIVMTPPEVNPHVKAQGKDVHWYKAELNEESVSPAARQLLESYSKVSPDEVLSHIMKIVSVP